MHWHKKHGEWEAHAYVDGASKYIGRYTTAMEAARARRDYMLQKTPESKKMINGVSSLSSVEDSEQGGNQGGQEQENECAEDDVMTEAYWWRSVPTEVSSTSSDPLHDAVWFFSGIEDGGRMAHDF